MFGRIKDAITTQTAYDIIIQQLALTDGKLYLNLFIDTSKTPRSGSHFVKKGTTLCYSKRIVSTMANQRKTLIL